MTPTNSSSKTLADIKKKYPYLTFEEKESMKLTTFFKKHGFPSLAKLMEVLTNTKTK